MRAANVKIAYCQSANGRDATSQKRFDAELDAYDGAVAQGIQPDGTTWDKIRQAQTLSEASGVPYGTSAWDKHIKSKLTETNEV